MFSLKQEESESKLHSSTLTKSGPGANDTGKLYFEKKNADIRDLNLKMRHLSHLGARIPMWLQQRPESQACAIVS